MQTLATFPGTQAPRSGSWFKASRTRDALELIRANPNAFALAAIIAQRARWADGFDADGLGLGEALMGDYADCGMTRQQYRTALAQLVKWRFATTRTTTRGTVAKLADTRLFEIVPATFNRLGNQRPTSEQPTGNQRTTTNIEHKNIEALRTREREGGALSRGQSNPTWQEFWEYCQGPECGLTTEWYARDKWEAANCGQWHHLLDWRAYARRCKGWWESDGRPMAAPSKVRAGKPQLTPDYSKGF